MATQSAQSASFLIKETFFWPDRGTAKDRPAVDARIHAGFQHRQKVVDAGKAHWYVSFGDEPTGILILHVTMDEYQEFLLTDPFFGVVKREVMTIYDASGKAAQFKRAMDLVKYDQRVNSPLTSGDLKIASLAPDMLQRLADTDTNSY